MQHLSLWKLCEVTWREGSFSGNKTVHVKESFGNEASIYFCRYSMKGTCRGGSYTEGSERPVMEGSGNGAFLL
jgi:hypothetical protein